VHVREKERVGVRRMALLWASLPSIVVFLIGAMARVRVGVCVTFSIRVRVEVSEGCAEG